MRACERFGSVAIVRAAALALWLVGCVEGADALDVDTGTGADAGGARDASTRRDGGPRDAGLRDAGLRDGGRRARDAGRRDAGPRDAGARIEDGGALDGGAVLTTAQIAGIVSAIDRAEIGAAAVARERALDDSVRSFAELMLAEHTATEKRLARLLEPEGITQEDTAIGRELEATAQQMTERLATLSGDELDREYVRSQITMHSQALFVIDTHVLVGATEDAQMRAFVVELRSDVVHHLHIAQQLQRTLLR